MDKAKDSAKYSPYSGQDKIAGSLSEETKQKIHEDFSDRRQIERQMNKGNHSQMKRIMSIPGPQ